MKKYIKTVLSLAVVLMTLIHVLPTVSHADQAGNTFARELSRLIQADNTDSFFSSMELTLGSNILTVDGEEEKLDVAPTINNNRTMLPIRAVAENTGATVEYETESKTVVITNDYGDEIRCPIGKTSMTVNNTVHILDVAPYIDGSKGRTYLPVRAVAEALNLEVDWDQKTSTATLTAPFQTSRILAWADRLDTSTLGAETVLHDDSGLWVLQFSSPGEAKAATETLQGRGIIAEPDRYIKLENPIKEMASAASGQDHYSWGAKDCKFDEFISAHSSQFRGTGVVAVVDTGVDSTHSFLKGKLLLGIDYVDEDITPHDGNGHGTHVAGTVIDCTGSTSVKILPVRVLNNEGIGYSSAIASGIKYAADYGADVINLSLGGPHSAIEDNAISYAVSKGTLVVASAGNENENTADYCPAHITVPGVVIVSNGDSSHNKAASSNFGNSVDLMAPGQFIKSAYPGNRYAELSGTSMAAPHVSAAAVLIDMATGNTLSPTALEQNVRSATTNNGVWKNQQYGCGFLDLSHADLPGNTVNPGISLSSSSISLEVGKSKTLTASVTPNGTSVSWSSSDPNVATVSGGTVTAVAPGTATVTAKIVYQGSSYTAKCSVTVSAPAVQPGISLNSNSISLEVGKSKTLTASVTPNGTSVSWSSSDPNVATVSGGTVTAVALGTATVTAKIVYQGTSYTAKCSVTVSAPAVKPGISLSSNSISLEVGKSKTLTASVTPNGTSVSWNSSDPDIAIVSGGTVIAVAPGTTTVTAKIVYQGTSYSARCSVDVSAPAPREPSDWTGTELPEKAGYRVETKEQYRSRSKETTESMLSSLSGWTMYDSRTTSSWGEWSDWKNGSVFNAGDNVQVETREVPGSSTTYYNLYCYKYWNAAAGNWYYSYSSSNGGTKCTARARASDCIPYQSFDGFQAYSYNGFNLWWVESTDKVTIQNSQYRTRSKTEATTYYYYRWGDWSDWQDIPLRDGIEEQVETRTLYRYVPTT